MERPPSTSYHVEDMNYSFYEEVPPLVAEGEDNGQGLPPKIDCARKLWRMWFVALSYLEEQQLKKHDPTALLDWLESKTLRLVTSLDYRKEEQWVRTDVVNQLCRLNCLMYGLGHDNMRALVLTEVAQNAWGNRVWPEMLLRGEGDYVNRDHTDEEVVALFQREPARIIMARVASLTQARMDDQALTLIDVYLRCVEDLPECFNEWNFGCDDLSQLHDARLALLFDDGRFNFLLLLLKGIPLQEGATSVRRLLLKDASLRLWTNKVILALLLFRYFLTKFLMQPLYVTYSLINDLFALCRYVYADVERTHIEEEVRRMIVPALTAEHLFVLSNALMREYGPVMRPFCIELCIRAVTTQMNDLEYFKIMEDTENVVVGKFCLSNGLIQLGKLLRQHVLVWREIALSAFSVYPSPALFNKVIQARADSEHIPTPIDSRIKERVHFTVTDEFILGERSSTIDVLLDPGSVVSAEVLGISRELCDDLLVVLISPRLKNLQWSLRWTILKMRCMKVMRMPLY